MRDASDTELIYQCRQGSQQAFNMLIRRYQQLVYGLCYHLVGDFTDAQNLDQETFVRVYLHVHQVRAIASFPAWLQKLTTRVCRRAIIQGTEKASYRLVAPDERILEIIRESMQTS